jgi:hypothetical protein
MARGLMLGLVTLALLALTAPLAHARSATGVRIRIGPPVVVPFVSVRPFHAHPRPFGVVSPYPVYAYPYSYPHSYPYSVYVSPPIVYAAPVYSVGTTYAGALQTVAPMPTVVQYPHGRYELRGDGVTVPYTWVWIPNPPPPPPDPAGSAVP